MFLKVLLFSLLFFNVANANEQKIFKKGEKYYDIMCNKKAIEAILYDTKDELLTQIKDKNYCENINEKKLQAVVHYLTKRNSLIQTKQKTLIPKNSKCQVCGMYVAKYPKWVTTIKEENNEIYYFDGVKDLMKYYFDPTKYKHKKRKFKEILVNDYYTLQPITAQTALYVIGSNIYGPMGNELIPFKTISDAKNFLNEHHGKKIVKFDEITEKLVYSLD